MPDIENGNLPGLMALLQRLGLMPPDQAMGDGLGTTPPGRSPMDEHEQAVMKKGRTGYRGDINLPPEPRTKRRKP